jgi:acyl-CoA dehydrogenase
MDDSRHLGREALRAWRDAHPDNFFSSDPLLAHFLRSYGEGALEAGAFERLSAFGADVARVIDPASRECERPENLPTLRRWSELGERTEEIVFHPAHHEAGRAAWRAQIIALQARPGRCLEQAVLIHLLAHCGEGGHACPVACTSGLVKALQRHGDEKLRATWLPRLLDPDYDAADKGSQFMTEVQGGSDVGANAVRAVADPGREGLWRIHGEKWFCSVANADQFLITARVGERPGTAGLGTFLVPRRLDDGSINHFTIRRLKTKLGTRAMASGEIDFDGAEAWPIGPIRDGFRIAAGVVLNTSRWVNALGSSGVMRRAYIEALTYARHRTAFGGPIGRYPLVRETLARMKTRQTAALASTLFLSRLIDLMEIERADSHQQAVYRFLVNANKYATSIAGSAVARDALEVLGGNGTIEDFSVVPRLVRDNFVFESWEGTHNVLAMQVLKDSARYGLLGNVHDEIVTRVGGVGGRETGLLLDALEHVSDTAARALREPAFGATHFRRLLERMMAIFQAALLLESADRASGEDADECAAMAETLTRLQVLPGYEPERDDGFARRMDRVLGRDLQGLW